MSLTTPSAENQPIRGILNLPETLEEYGNRDPIITTTTLQQNTTPIEFPDNKVLEIPIIQTILLDNYRLDLTDHYLTARGHVGQSFISSAYGEVSIEQIKLASNIAYEWVEECDDKGRKPFLVTLVWDDCKLPTLAAMQNFKELNGMLQAVARAGGWTTDIGSGFRFKNFVTMMVDKFTGTVTHTAPDLLMGFRSIADNG